MKGNTTQLLYDLSVDIQEQNNVAAQHPDIGEKLIIIRKKEHYKSELNTFIIPVLENEAREPAKAQ